AAVAAPSRAGACHAAGFAECALRARLSGRLGGRAPRATPLRAAADLPLAARAFLVRVRRVAADATRAAGPSVARPIARRRPLRLQTVFDPADGSVEVHSRAAEGEREWTLHGSAVVRPRSSDAASPPLRPGDVQRRCPREFSAGECYEYLRKLGLEYGPLFQ